MKKSLLIHFFDNQQWTFELLVALFKFRDAWQVKELYDAFCEVCHYVDSPPGSASEAAVTIDHWIHIGYATYDKQTRIVTAGKSASGGPVALMKIGDDLVPFIQPALDQKIRRELRAKKFQSIMDRHERGEITTEQSNAEVDALNIELPHPSRKKS